MCFSFTYGNQSGERGSLCLHHVAQQATLERVGEGGVLTDGGGRAGMGWVRFRASCAVGARVSQAVSGSCDQKLSAQQLETTYVTRLQVGIR